MEIELKELIIKILKESRDSLSPVEIFNSLVLKDHTDRSIYPVEIEHIRFICKVLVHDGILVEKEPGIFAFVHKTGNSGSKVKPNPESPQSVEQTSPHVKNKTMNKLEEFRFFDLFFCIILIIFSICFILIPPFNQTFIRIIIALPFLIFVPGYLFITVMFPRKGELSPIERFTLSIGFSIAITVFDGFALNYTTWGFRPNSIAMSLSLIMALLLIAAFLRRRMLGEQAYYFSIGHIRSFYSTLKSKETETGPEYDPALGKMLIKTMIIAILLVSAMLIYAKVTFETEKFTSFYILGSNGKAEDYPDDVYIDKLNELMVGIENYEYEPVNYTLRIQLDGQIFTEQQVYLEHKDKWLENVTYIPRMTSSIAMAGLSGDTKSRLEFILLKDGLQYRSLHLWFKPVFDISEFASRITLVNGDMEQTSGWNFKGASQNITGSYTNKTWVSASHSYEINFTASASGEFGALYQNVTVDKETLAIISFYVNDSSPTINDNISKQVLFDDSVVWEEKMGNNSWEKIRVPVFLKRNATLSFRVYDKIPVNYTVQVWWDNIKIEPYESISRNITSLNTYLQSDFKTRGTPIAMKGKVRIDGANFPGFYYNIDDNKSYEKLDILFSDNNIIEPGNATYISTFDGDEISLVGSKYKLIDKNNSGLLSKLLFKNASKTMKLYDQWYFDNGYSLKLDMLSSKGDTAIVTLRKGGKYLYDFRLSKGRIFEYKTKVAGITFTIFKMYVESISLDSVNLTGTELYSDTQITLNAGDSIGDFKITDINSTEIVMNNSHSIEIKDGALMLDNLMRFDVINDLAIPYASSGEARGMPHTVLPGSLIKIDGSNYPGFYYDFENKQPVEELYIQFDNDFEAGTGKATYKTRSNGNELHFLGKSYWLPDPKRINIIGGLSQFRETIPANGTLMLDDGYEISFKENPEGGIQLFIRKENKKLRESINASNISSSIGGLYFETYTTTFKRGRIKSNVIYEPGDEFEYWVEYSDMFLLMSGELKAMDNNNITLEIKQYQLPREFLPGMSFGEFEIDNIANGTIVLKNIKPMKLEPGKETPLLGGTIIMRTSAKEPIAYPLMGKTE